MSGGEDGRHGSSFVRLRVLNKLPHLTMSEIYRQQKKEYFADRFGIATLKKEDFIRDLKTAIESYTPFAAGRIGISEQFWMYYPVFLNEHPSAVKSKVFERHLRLHGFTQAGIFPADPLFYLDYNKMYVESARTLDYVGLILDRVIDPQIIRFYGLTNKFVYYRDLVPDKSIPPDSNRCYLQYLRGKRILIVCPFAELLKERATKEIFERVWSKTGKQWFYPESVDAVEFPYGFSSDAYDKYPNALKLFESIASNIRSKEFDVALIAAAGLTVPIASYVKSIGKISISPGGDLQLLFGVIGARWRDQERWKRDYFNEAWIDMPSKYKPKEIGVCDSGAYW